MQRRKKIMLKMDQKCRDSAVPEINFEGSEGCAHQIMTDDECSEKETGM